MRQSNETYPGIRVLGSDRDEGAICVLCLRYSFCVGRVVELGCVLVALDFHLDTSLVAAVA